MVRPRGLRALLLAASTLATSLGLVSCGSGNTVDNSSCPTSSAGYYAEVGTNDDSNVVGQRIPQMPHDHIVPPATVNYEHNPPTSGCHYLQDKDGHQLAPIKPGVYTQHVDAEYWVHNLEHGYIAVLYRCPQGCDADFTQLREWMAKQPPDPQFVALVKSNPGFKPYTKIIIVPWPTMTPKFAAVSWDYYDPMDTVDTTELQHFYDNHVDQAPEGSAQQPTP
ncbi:MAG TPA: DUF3105 domain-containing protein [Candidatus Dormibacteraeota bacterium]|nr:DUF3105 domain-containing protein [Candidatus Dormibacteraeota bacterium]